MNPGVLSAVLFLVAGADGVDDSLFGPTELKAAMPGEVLPGLAAPGQFLAAQPAPGDVLAVQASAGQVLPIPGTPISCQPALTIPDSSDTDAKMPTVWLGTEYLMWWTQKAPLPVRLVTVNPNPLASYPNAALGTAGTEVAYGGNGLGFGMASGMRVTAGMTLSADAGLFVEGSWLMPGETNHLV